MRDEARGSRAGGRRRRGNGPARLLAVALLAALAASAAAQTPPAAVALDDVEWAGLLWRGADGGLRPAPSLSAEVEIRVTGLVTRARVTQRFTNPGEEWLEGLYVFPLPDGAAVDRLRMVVGDRVIEGEVREREAARRVYEEARREGRRASLLERQRPDVFTTRLANVAPGERVEVVIELEGTVAYADGTLRLRFPTVVEPRYLPAGPPSPDAVLPPASTSAGLPAAAAPPPPTAHGGALRAAVERSVGAVRGAGATVAAALGSRPPLRTPWSLTVHLDPGVPLARLESPSHAIAVAPEGARGWRVTLAAGEVEADRDFRLEWDPVAGAAPRTALFTEEVDGDVYALLMVLPPAAAAADWTPLEREVIFVLDTSGSMAGPALAQAKAALVDALGRLRPWDSFNVIEFNDRARPPVPRLLAGRPGGARAGRRLGGGPGGRRRHGDAAGARPGARRAARLRARRRAAPQAGRLPHRRRGRQRARAARRDRGAPRRRPPVHGGDRRGAQRFVHAAGRGGGARDLHLHR